MEPTTVNLRQVLARMNSPSVVTVRQILTMMPLLGYAELGRFLNCRAGEMWIGRMLPRCDYDKLVNPRAPRCNGRWLVDGRQVSVYAWAGAKGESKRVGVRKLLKNG